MDVDKKYSENYNIYIDIIIFRIKFKGWGK